jgi:hypothetical protein
MVFHAFLIGHEMPFTFERPLCTIGRPLESVHDLERSLMSNDASMQGTPCSAIQC